jgi:hypothetical protein
MRSVIAVGSSCETYHGYNIILNLLRKRNDVKSKDEVDANDNGGCSEGFGCSGHYVQVEEENSYQTGIRVDRL